MLREKRIAALFAVSLALTALILAGYAFGALKSLELSSVDKRFKLRGKTEDSRPKDIVLVKVDDVTFGELKQWWPFPRGTHAALIDELSKQGAKVIAFDVQFTEASDDPDQDNALVESIARAGNVVLTTEETDGKGGTGVLGGDDVVKSVNATVGNSLFPEDSGAVIRRFERSRGGIPTFSVAVAKRAGFPAPESDFSQDGTAWIDFYGPPESIRSISYSRALRGDAPAAFFKDKIVVVGSTAPSLQDRHRASTSGSGEMAGPEIQANAIGTVLNGFPLHGVPEWFNVALILLLGLATPLASLRFDARGAFGVAVATAVVFTVCTWIAFVNFGIINAFVYPLLALVLSSIGALGVNYVSAAYERERVRDVFSRFVADSVVDQVLEESSDGIKLGGKRVEATVLFSDLRSFTTFSEKLPPEEVISILNRYLTEMSDAILDAEGTLVSYMGDGIMAVFGAPIESNDHADRALAASRDMLERMHGFNDWMTENGYGPGFKMGLGMNTGVVMSGNVGSERRLEYTAIGDTTNTAARLEGATKGTSYQLFMAESSREALSEKPDDVVFVDEFPIRGRDEGVRVWGLVEADVEA